MNPELHLEAAAGYLQLEMPDESLEELASVDFLTRCSEQFMILRLTALASKRDWSEVLLASRMLRHRYPECEMAFIAGATALVETGRYRDALELLLSGPATLRRKPVTHLQIAYCEIRLGNEHGARLSLELARKLNPELAEEASEILFDGPIDDMAESN